MADLYEALQHADEAELFYGTDARPGISRRRRGTGFSYAHPDGKTVDAGTRRWIESELVIPPAWTDVWICPNPDGHLLATGRDAKGRKVYLYHSRWREVRDSNKYHRLRDFGRRVPAIREQVEADLAGRGLTRGRVLAAVVDAAAEALGNTRTVCRSCYVHPGVDEAYRDGSLLEAWGSSRAASRFSRGESCVLKVLESRSQRDDAG